MQAFLAQESGCEKGIRQSPGYHQCACPTQRWTLSVLDTISAHVQLSASQEKMPPFPNGYLSQDCGHRFFLQPSFSLRDSKSNAAGGLCPLYQGRYRGQAGGSQGH